VRGTKFEDVITALASTVVLYVIIFFVIGLPLSVSAISSGWGGDVETIVGLFVAAAIVGYVFAKRIWSENGLEAITKISVLGAVVELLYVANEPSLPSWGSVVTQDIAKAYPTSTFSASQMLNLESQVLADTIFLNVVIVLVLGFVGLYVGSKLRRTPKSSKLQQPTA
jgi:predicted Na+-dependent transporter